MTNTPALLDRLEKSGYKLSFVSQCLGISRQSLHSKVHNKAEFRASEIDAMCKLLNIGVKDRMAIFFAKAVD